jgi:hypothetical protein
MVNKNIVPDTVSRTSEDECKWYCHQMIYFPETIIQWTQCYVAGHARWHLLCAWSFLEAVMGSSSLFLNILSCLLTSPVWTQLMLTVPLGAPVPPPPKWRPFPQDPRTLPFQGLEQICIPLRIDNLLALHTNHVKVNENYIKSKEPQNLKTSRYVFVVRPRPCPYWPEKTPEDLVWQSL